MMLSTVSGNAWALATAGTTRANRGTSRRMATLQRLWAGLMCGALGACTSSGEPPLRLGTTYTVEQSGALALLDSLARPTPTTVVGPSGQILAAAARGDRSEEHTSELQSPCNLVCRLLLEKKKKKRNTSKRLSSVTQFQ